MIEPPPPNDVSPGNSTPKKQGPTMTNEVSAPEVREEKVEVSMNGQWTEVPALAIGTRLAVSRGGWLKIACVHQEDWVKEEIDRPELWVRALRNRPIGESRSDLFTFTQKLPHTDPQYSYHVEWDSTAAVRVRSFKQWWDSVPQETRKNVRRAERRGLTVSLRPLDDDLVGGIMTVNNESPLVQGRPARHFGKSYQQVWRDQLDYLDRSSFICAHAGSELVGFLKLVRCGVFASVLTTLTKPSHYDKRPANALIARAMQLCEEEGIEYLVYGLLNYGNKRNGSLREFKLRNGFSEILVPRYYVPLTLKGKMALKSGMHRGLIGVLPSGAIRLVANLRNRLNSLNQSLGRRSSMAEQPNRIRQTDGSNPPAGSIPNLKQAKGPADGSKQRPADGPLIRRILSRPGTYKS